MEPKPPQRYRCARAMRYVLSSASCLCLFVCVACGHSEPTQSERIAAHKDQCETLAESRLGLYVHSDIYPLTDKEKSDALASLNSECLKQYGVQPAPATAATPAPVAALPPGMQMAPSDPQPAPAPQAPEPKRQAVAAPVASVASTPVAPPPAAAIAAQPLTPPVNSPFAVAKAPSPDVALKLRQPLDDYKPATNDNGKSELENIITKQ